jgi:histidine triad (HIT) family protein
MPLDDAEGDMEDCEFCRIVRGGLPARIVYESESTLAFFPLHPAVIGHTLIIPKSHVVDFLALDDGIASDLAVSTVHVGRALRRALKPEGMNAITSAGKAATQTIFHLHIHLVPRRFGDVIGDFWPPMESWPRDVEDRVAELVREECG